jgi:proline iminopeptidase
MGGWRRIELLDLRTVRHVDDRPALPADPATHAQRLSFDVAERAQIAAGSGGEIEGETGAPILERKAGGWPCTLHGDGATFDDLKGFDPAAEFPRLADAKRFVPPQPQSLVACVGFEPQQRHGAAVVFDARMHPRQTPGDQRRLHPVAVGTGDIGHMPAMAVRACGSGEMQSNGLAVDQPGQRLAGGGAQTFDLRIRTARLSGAGRGRFGRHNRGQAQLATVGQADGFAVQYPVGLGRLSAVQAGRKRLPAGRRGQHQDRRGKPSHPHAESVTRKQVDGGPSDGDSDVMPADSTSRSDLYPPIEPYAAGMLDLDGRHTMYWEQSGNPKGTPVVFLHGGPGAGSTPAHRRFFDPHHYRVIIFDQRGAGRSRPHGDLVDNTTPHLVDDIERLRRHLGVDSWLVFGGSWGSTLALAYAEAHPARCRALVLRGIFLCRPVEIDWFLYGLRHVFPEAWRTFAGFLPEAEREDILEAYFRRLSHPDPAIHMPAARAWSTYEGACSTLLPSPETVSAFAEDRMALGLARIEAHYFRNNSFLDDDQLLRGARRLAGIPATIVQGRYDMVCPIISADDLVRAWPEATYIVVPDAGHSAMEPGIRAALVAAMERYKTL